MNYNNNYENTSQRDKRAVLEHAALTKSPEEIAALCRQLGHVENSARALGLACRSAWLLEFKNRIADFAAERDRAEKRMMRELNANPNSVTELKKIWGYEKGTVRAAQSDHPDNTAGA